MEEVLLRVEQLKKEYKNRKGIFRGTQKIVYAVKDVSFQIERGKILGLVGESGCGKSTVAKTILNLIQADGGSVSFRNTCLFDY